MKAPHQKLALNKLLSQRNQFPERSDAIDAEIDRLFSRQVSMLALDMSGFSRLTAHHGIVHFLAMVHKMAQVATPAVVANGGEVVKQEADNLFAAFTHPQPALEAALDINRAMDAINLVLPPERAIRVCIGIGFGQTLLLERHDMFGHEMNLACKLGEDIARAKEILLTDAAHAALPPQVYQCEHRVVDISGMAVDAWRFVTRRFEPLGSDGQACA